MKNIKKLTPGLLILLLCCQSIVKSKNSVDISPTYINVINYFDNSRVLDSLTISNSYFDMDSTGNFQFYSKLIFKSRDLEIKWNSLKGDTFFRRFVINQFENDTIHDFAYNLFLYWQNSEYLLPFQVYLSSNGKNSITIENWRKTRKLEEVKKWK